MKSNRPENFRVVHFEMYFMSHQMKRNSKNRGASPTYKHGRSISSSIAQSKSNKSIESKTTDGTISNYSDGSIDTKKGVLLFFFCYCVIQLNAVDSSMVMLCTLSCLFTKYKNLRETKQNRNEIKMCLTSPSKGLAIDCYAFIMILWSVRTFVFCSSSVSFPYNLEVYWIEPKRRKYIMVWRVRVREKIRHCQRVNETEKR